MKRAVLSILLCLVLIMLTGCGQENDVISSAPTTEPVTALTAIVTVEELEGILTDYPSLREADFSGSTCYAALASFSAAHPEIAVTYTVDLGGTTVSPDTRQLTLSPSDFQYGTLRSALAYLPDLESVYFEDCMLTPETLSDLRAIYPNLSINCSVAFCGTTYETSVASMDLSAYAPEDILAESSRLALFTELTDIELMTDDGTTQFTLSDAAQLQELVPSAMLHFSFELFGQQVSTEDEEISYANQYIGNKEGNLEILRMALSILKGCKRFVLDNCHFENETMAEVRDEFRATTKVVWRIWYGKGSILTDRTMIRHVYDLYDSNSVNLIYCEDCEYLDIGHNEYLKTCEFVRGMPKLKAIILSGSMVSDLSPFEDCPELEFLELAYCGYVTDLSPLASCGNLVRLNVAYTKASDLSPLDSLNMEVLVDAKSAVSEEEAARFDAAHPTCLVQHTGDADGDDPYKYPWRYELNGEPNSYYALLQEQFHYPNTANTIY